jgi:SAM-dependent methyltransferase
LTRGERLLSGADGSTRILEIGPGYNPVAPKSAGWNTHVVDHASRDELRAKYAGAPVNVDCIQNVDSIWDDGPLHKAIQSDLHGKFDLLIASHVLEHLPDLVGFLASAAILLKPDGAISLAIPDKRYCFDYFKPLSTTGDVLDAFRAQRTRHTFRSNWNHVAYATRMDGLEAWGQHAVNRPEFIVPFAEAARFFETPADENSATYTDCHAWQFSPASFRLIMFELAQLGVSDWRLHEPTGSEGCEFLVCLRRGIDRMVDPQAIQQHRMSLLREQLIEMQDQLIFAIQGGLLPSRDPLSAEVIERIVEQVRQLGQRLDSVDHRLSYFQALLGRIAQWLTPFRVVRRIARLR